MIAIKRPASPPAVLQPDSDARKKAEKRIKAIIDAGNIPTSKDFSKSALWGRKAVRKALWDMQNGRCCYCERYRDTMRESDIEHFRPKTECSDKNPSKPAYWWLAYEWDNLFFGCRLCNQEYKKTQFPIRGTRANSPKDDLEAEDKFLINPAEENPEEFIDYDFADPLRVMPNGKAPNRQRGNRTIDICKLDRVDLALQRRAIIPALQGIHRRMIVALESGNEILEKRIGKEITAATSAKSKLEFIGMRRAYFRARGLEEFVSSD